MGELTDESALAGARLARDDRGAAALARRQRKERAQGGEFARRVLRTGTQASAEAVREAQAWSNSQI